MDVRRLAGAHRIVALGRLHAVVLSALPSADGGHGPAGQTARVLDLGLGQVMAEILLPDGMVCAAHWLAGAGVVLFICMTDATTRVIAVDPSLLRAVDELNFDDAVSQVAGATGHLALQIGPHTHVVTLVNDQLIANRVPRPGATLCGTTGEGVLLYQQGALEEWDVATQSSRRKLRLAGAQAPAAAALINDVLFAAQVQGDASRLIRVTLHDGATDETAHAEGLLRVLPSSPASKPQVPARNTEANKTAHARPPDGATAWLMASGTLLICDAAWRGNAVASKVAGASWLDAQSLLATFDDGRLAILFQNEAGLWQEAELAIEDRASAPDVADASELPIIATGLAPARWTLATPADWSDSPESRAALRHWLYAPAGPPPRLALIEQLAAACGHSDAPELQVADIRSVLALLVASELAGAVTVPWLRLADVIGAPGRVEAALANLGADAAGQGLVVMRDDGVALAPRVHRWLRGQRAS